MTILSYHRHLVKKKFARLFSNKKWSKFGRKPPPKELTELVLEFKQKKPNYRYKRISMQIIESFGLEINITQLALLANFY